MSPAISCNLLRDRLSPWLDGELSASASGEVAAHLEKCPPCAAELNDLLVAAAASREVLSGAERSARRTRRAVREPAQPRRSNASVELKRALRTWLATDLLAWLDHPSVDPRDPRERRERRSTRVLALLAEERARVRVPAERARLDAIATRFRGARGRGGFPKFYAAIRASGFLRPPPPPLPRKDDVAARRRAARWAARVMQGH